MVFEPDVVELNASPMKDTLVAETYIHKVWGLNGNIDKVGETYFDKDLFVDFWARMVRRKM